MDNIHSLHQGIDAGAGVLLLPCLPAHWVYCCLLRRCLLPRMQLPLHQSFGKCHSVRSPGTHCCAACCCVGLTALVRGRPRANCVAAARVGGVHVWVGRSSAAGAILYLGRDARQAGGGIQSSADTQDGIWPGGGGGAATLPSWAALSHWLTASAQEYIACRCRGSAAAYTCIRLCLLHASVCVPAEPAGCTYIHACRSGWVAHRWASYTYNCTVYSTCAHMHREWALRAPL